MRPNTSVAEAIVARRAPTRSIERASGFRDSRTVSRMPRRMSSTIGTLIVNAQCHEKLVVSHPPSSGPSAAMPPIVEPQTAKAMPRSRPW